jgi:hypothetical protein
MAAVLAALGFLLVLGLLQLHGIEEQLITQGRQIRTLGEAVDRLGARSPAAGPTSATGSEPASAQTLHAGVADFLQPSDEEPPPRGARLDGKLVRGWASGDPKGFNPMIENAADLSELIEQYAALPIAERNVCTDPRSGTEASPAAWRSRTTSRNSSSTSGRACSGTRRRA